MTNKNCFSEDTGLEVEALNGEPGVHSARYAGECRIFNDNIEKLLNNSIILIFLHYLFVIHSMKQKKDKPGYCNFEFDNFQTVKAISTIGHLNQIEIFFLHLAGL